MKVEGESYRKYMTAIRPGFVGLIAA